MSKKSVKSAKFNWQQNVDFATVALSIIIFGSAVAYVMIQAVK